MSICLGGKKRMGEPKRSKGGAPPFIRVQEEKNNCFCKGETGSPSSGDRYYSNADAAKSFGLQQSREAGATVTQKKGRRESKGRVITNRGKKVLPSVRVIILKREKRQKHGRGEQTLESRAGRRRAFHLATLRDRFRVKGKGQEDALHPDTGKLTNKQEKKYRSNKGQLEKDHSAPWKGRERSGKIVDTEVPDTVPHNEG